MFPHPKKSQEGSENSVLRVICLVSIAVLLFCLIKLKLNTFAALSVTAFGTGIACQMPLMEVANTVTNKLGAALGGIGTMTGLMM